MKDHGTDGPGRGQRRACPGRVSPSPGGTRPSGHRGAGGAVPVGLPIAAMPTTRTEARRRRHLRRTLHHLVLFPVSVLAGAAVYRIVGSDDPYFGVSMATAYTSLGLLAVTLIIGPVNVLRGSRNPVSTDLRRDVGIWTALTAVVHVGVGLQVHLRGRMAQYFLYPPDPDRLVPLRYDAFGIANWSGLAAALILLALLLTSNDRSLRALGAARWKGLHRTVYACVGLVVLHGLLYQIALEDRGVGWISFFAALVLVTATLQLRGAAERGRAAVGPAEPGAADGT